MWRISAAAGSFGRPTGAMVASAEETAVAAPSWGFGPGWMVLYLTMGLAHYAFMMEAGEGRRRNATLFQIAQLGLNAAWAPLFFGLKRPNVARTDLALLTAAARTTQREFGKVSPFAEWLLYPYPAGLWFAANLNGGICWLNRERASG